MFSSRGATRPLNIDIFGGVAGISTFEAKENRGGGAADKTSSSKGGML